MSQRAEALAVRNLILVVSVLAIQLDQFGMVRDLRQLGHDREGVALGALLAGLAVAVFAGRSKITSRLEVTTEFSR